MDLPQACDLAPDSHGIQSSENAMPVVQLGLLRL